MSSIFLSGTKLILIDLKVHEKNDFVEVSKSFESGNFIGLLK